jgi:anti-sigma-K factor RskA
MSTMDPEIHSLTGAYACDALDAADRAAFEQHLAVCPTCTQEVAELQETVARLGVAVAEEPPPGLKASVDAAIGRTRQLAPETDTPGVRVGWFRRNFTASLGWGVAAAMACVVAILGVRVADQQNQIDGANRRNSAISALLAAPDVQAASGVVRTGGNAHVLVSRKDDEAAISLSGLAAAPAGKAYQLWMIGPDGTRSGGLLPTTERGTAGSVIAHGLGDAQTIGLTIEPAQGSAQPTSAPVLLLPMPA